MEKTLAVNKRNSLLILLVTIAFTVGIVFLLWKEIKPLTDFIAASGWLGMLLSIAIYALLGASPIPSEPLTILISASFGPFSAMVVAGVGNLLSALVEYFIGHKLSDVADFEKRKSSLPFGLGMLPVDSLVALIGARMLPGYGPKFVSVIAGFYKVSLWRYIWTSALSTFLGAAIFAYGGFGLLHLGKSR